MMANKIPVWIVIVIGVMSYYGIGFAITYKLIGEPAPNNTLAQIIFMDLLQLCFLLVPAYLYAKLAHPKSPSTFLGLTVMPSPLQVILAIVMLAALFPITSFLINMQSFIYDIFGKKTFADNYLFNYELYVSMMLTTGGLFYKMFATMSLSLTPAFCEEFFFRGYIQSSLSETAFWKKVFVVGALFGVFHFDPVHTLGLISIGVFLSWLKEISQSLWLPIIIHFLNNIVMSVMVVMGMNIQEIGKSRFEFFLSTETLILTPIGIIVFFSVGTYMASYSRRLSHSNSKSN